MARGRHDLRSALAGHLPPPRPRSTAVRVPPRSLEEVIDCVVLHGYRPDEDDTAWDDVRALREYQASGSAEGERYVLDILAERCSWALREDWCTSYIHGPVGVDVPCAVCGEGIEEEIPGARRGSAGEVLLAHHDCLPANATGYNRYAPDADPVAWMTRVVQRQDLLRAERDAALAWSHDEREELAVAMITLLEDSGYYDAPTAHQLGEDFCEWHADCRPGRLTGRALEERDRLLADMAEDLSLVTGDTVTSSQYGPATQGCAGCGKDFPFSGDGDYCRRYTPGCASETFHRECFPGTVDGFDRRRDEPPLAWIAARLADVHAGARRVRTGPWDVTA